MTEKAARAVSSLQQKLPNVTIKGPKRLISDAQYFNATTKDETLIRQLDSNSMAAKLEAMKKIIAQLSKGKDVSEFFPTVVKNVACQSLEVKKLVYLYVMHYAEEKHDEALLSIAHFQKDMTDKSQHVRALSLRVLSSIRVPIIVQIVLLAIRKCISDPSPWVRKAAALAVPKIYDLNQEEKPQLVQIIDKLLDDHSPTVHGAAAHAFLVVCPDNMELIHKHYRKLVRGLAQVDEWGQVVLLNMLLRYSRTQFLNPFREGYQKKTKFYGDATASDSEEELVEYDMDDDHRLLLTNALPLIQSSNHAVIIAVASLFLHLAPEHEFSPKIGKALLRILHSTRERQYVALLTIHSLASQRPAAFRPYIKQFFVTPADPIFTQQKKIDTMALLADSTNVSTVIGEFKAYLQNSPQTLLVGTVRALGRVAFLNSDVSDTCLATLAELTTHQNEIVVGESVVVTRHLLQKVQTGHGKIIIRLTRLLDSLELPLARASITWLVGEYLHIPQVAQVAPDTFRTLVKGFAKEQNAVKQQVVVLGSKLLLHEFEEESVKERVRAIFEHLLTLVKYDESFTLRDRARLARKILLDESIPELREKAKLIFASVKEEADFSDPGADRLRFQIGSMSHVLNSTVPGYMPLQDFPKEQPDPSTRDAAFLSPSSSEESGSDSGDTFYSDDEEDESGSSDDETESESETEDSESSDEPRKRKPAKKQPPQKAPPKKEEESEEEEEESEEEDSDDESETESSDPPPRKSGTKGKSSGAAKAREESGGADLLQFMGEFTPAQGSGSPKDAKHADPSSDPLASTWEESHKAVS